MGVRSALATFIVVLGVLLGFLALAGYWVSMLWGPEWILSDSEDEAGQGYPDTGEDAGEKEVYEGNSTPSSGAAGSDGYGVLAQDPDETGAPTVPLVHPEPEPDTGLDSRDLPRMDPDARGVDTPRDARPLDVGIPEQTTRGITQVLSTS